MKVVDDITALGRLRLICPQVDHATTFTEEPVARFTAGFYHHDVTEIINNLLQTNKWLACEALANSMHSYGVQPIIYEKNKVIYDEIKEDIDDYFNY